MHPQAGMTYVPRVGMSVLAVEDKDAYGRVVHLQPMEWTAEGWPVIGVDNDGDGVGEPVGKYRKPSLKSLQDSSIATTERHGLN